MSASRYERFLGDYDRAGYNAVSPLHYSGDPSHPQAWRKRYWPVSQYVPSATSDSVLLERFQNLQILIPGAEEVGFDHILSPFLTEYIEKWEGGNQQHKYPFHYESTQACIERIHEMGGLAVIAHPWEGLKHYDSYSGFQAIEVYSGYSNHKFNTGEQKDTNAEFLRVWDHLLSTKSTKIWGIGVNDWFGPGREDLRAEYPGDIDSGKTVLLIKEWTLESLRDSFEKGAMFAVKDLGIEKGDYPHIDSIQMGEHEIRIESDAEVEWIAGQTIRATGEVFSLENLPASMKYIRAQVRNATGEVFVQPFTLEASQ
ncbi:MAG: hypothetical protein KC994_01585 [Candidatus Omnitrophica bacterium]|nr:hypothetical protein [Candidatus Omnitrophota bacterium]